MSETERTIFELVDRVKRLEVALDAAEVRLRALEPCSKKSRYPHSIVTENGVARCSACETRIWPPMEVSER